MIEVTCISILVLCIFNIILKLSTMEQRVLKYLELFSTK